nr:hypothetical protein [uncultured Draconibacterium sp.]
MDNINTLEKISNLIDKYFTVKIKNPNYYSDSIYIRKALEKRVEEYFPKSTLNPILISKGFHYKIKDEKNYFFNISLSDIKILSNSDSILKKLSEKTNWSFNDYAKLHKFKNVDLYRYKFKYIIKYKFQSSFIEKNYTELDVYKVIAKELRINLNLTKQYIETFNHVSFPDIPDDILTQLLQLFDINKNESLTNENVVK